MSTALAVRQEDLPQRRDQSPGLSAMSFEQVVAMGNVLVATGFLPEHIKNGGQAAAIIMTGNELGMQPMRALRSLAMVKGKVTEYADSQLARFKADGGRAQWKKLDEKIAVLWLKHPNGDEHEETFTLADAERAGLTKASRSGEPSMFSKFPKAMLRSRAITAALKSIGWEGGVGTSDPDEARAFAPNAPMPPLGTDVESATDIGRDVAGDVRSIDERAPLDEPEVACPKCGGRMWDNRTTKATAKAPDYKCRDKSCDGVFWPGQWPPKPSITDEQKAKITELLTVADLSDKKRAKLEEQLANTEKPLTSQRAHEIIEGLTKLVPSPEAPQMEEITAHITALLKNDKFTTDEVKAYVDRAVKAESVAQLQALVQEIEKFIASPF